MHPDAGPGAVDAPAFVMSGLPARTQRTRRPTTCEKRPTRPDAGGDRRAVNVPTNPRYANGHRRRRVRARLLAQGGTCPWPACPWPGEPFDRTLYYLDPKAPEVDEIIPVSRGGDPLARANVRLMHRWCNQQRGNGTRAVRKTAPASGFPTSTEW